MAKRTPKARSKKDPYGRVLTADEIAGLRALLSKQSDAADTEDFSDYDDYDDGPDLPDPEEEQRLKAQAEWVERQTRRLEAIKTCLRRGHHETDRSEGVHKNGQLLVLMLCKCGASGRAVIGFNEKPPKGWT